MNAALKKMRALAEAAALIGEASGQDVWPKIVIGLIDEVDSQRLSAKNMGLDADCAREDRDRMQAKLQDLRTVVQNTMALGLITEDQPLLLARARAALGETK
jgi:hypothetical protein